MQPRPTPTRTPRRTRLLLVATAAFALAGCSAETDPDTDVLAAGSASVVVETEDYTGDVGGQGFGGVLTLVDGCVGFGSGADGVVALFPPGTTVRGEDDEMVVETRGRELRLGDTVSGGTRLDESGRAPLTSFGDLDETAPESCRGRDATPFDIDG